jgi:23S rRNA (uracil1939-C5)-methyltransferase
LSILPAPDAVLLDPPRAGAAAVMPELIRRKVGRILYVSCDAATLARDLSMLATDYKVTNAGIMDMFPQTHHVETMVMLEYRGK